MDAELKKSENDNKRCSKCRAKEGGTHPIQQFIIKLRPFHGKLFCQKCIITEEQKVYRSHAQTAYSS